MLKKIFPGFFLIFIALYILTVPFTHPWIPDIATWLHPASESLVKWTGKHILNIRHPYTSQLVSDSTGLYIHVFNLSVIAALGALMWAIAAKPNRNDEKLFYWFRVVVSYYLALQLLDYGFNKLFKWQFYLPEPNTLYTSMGNTPRDLMYWSTMGLSRPYTIFAGSTELLAAILLLFRRTRVTGALIAFVVLCNVVAINFSYDISVKVYSCFLLLLCCFIMAPDSGRLFAFFTGKKNIPAREEGPVFNSARSKQIYVFLKLFIIAGILFSTSSVYVRENNFNDDKAPRPAFHGAYEVFMFVKNGDTIPPLLTDSSRWRRVFVHRRGYFITQDMADNMQDYQLLTDTVNHNFIIEREEDHQQFNLLYTQYPDSTISLNGKIDKDSLWVKIKPIDMRQLPALQHEFNWTIDN